MSDVLIVMLITMGASTAFGVCLGVVLSLIDTPEYDSNVDYATHRSTIHE